MSRLGLIGVALVASIVSTAAAAQETTTYAYDVHGRLVEAERAVTAGGGDRTVFTLDAADNRLNVTREALPASLVGQPAEGDVSALDADDPPPSDDRQPATAAVEASEQAAPQDVGAASSTMSTTGIAPPQSFELTDARGVDLTSLSLKVDTPTISIGPEGQGGLSYFASYDSSVQGWRHSTFGGVNRAFPIPPANQNVWLQVTTLGQSVAFIEKHDGTLDLLPETGNGSMVFDSGSNEYRYTALDGTVSAFSRGLETLRPYQASRGLLVRIERPNGEILTFNYLSAGDRRRVTSITTNLGYQLHFDYASQTAGTDDWMRFTRVTAFNMAVDPCAPTAVSCTFSRTWPHLAFSQTSTTFTVTDAGGGVTRLVKNAGGEIGEVYRPASTTTPELTITYEPAETWGTRVATVSDGLGTWTYGMPAPPEGEISYATFSGYTDPLDESVRYDFFVYAPGGDAAMSSRATSLVKITDQLGRVTNLHQDGGGLDYVIRPEGDRTNYLRTTRGDFAGYTLIPKGGGTPITAQLYYDDCSTPIRCGRPTRMVDERGATTDYTYDARGNLLTVTQPAPVSGAVRPQTRYSYQDFHAWWRQPGGAITVSPTAVSRPIGSSSCQTGAGQSGVTPAACLGTADEVVSVTTYQSGSSSAASNVLPLTASSGAGDGSLTATTTTTWSMEGDPVTVDGPLPGADDTVWNAYEVTRRPLGSIGPDPDDAGPLPRPAARTTYDLAGRPTTVAAGSATAQTQAAFDAMTVLSRVVTEYDVQGRRLRERAYQGTGQIGVTDYGYDIASRPICSTVRMNPATFGALPADGCALTPASGSIPRDRITYSVLDEAGQVREIQTGYGLPSVRTVREQDWTLNGKIDWVEDANGNRSAYAYDGFDRLTHLYFPSPTLGAGMANTDDFEQYGYDDAGNRTSLRVRDNRTFTYTYDALNRQTVMTVPGGGTADDVFSRYDNLGRRLSARFTHATTGQGIVWTWDALGRQLTETSYGRTLTSQYDLAGRRTRLTWPAAGGAGALYVDYDWDLVNRMDRVRENGATSGAGLLVDFAYDAQGRRTTIARGNGATTTYAYTANSRNWNLVHNLAGTAHDVRFSVAFSPAGQITSRTISNSLYGHPGALLDEAYTPDGLNRYAGWAGHTPEYDGRQNMLSDGIRQNRYDVENRLIRTAAPGGDVFHLSYDPLGRLLETTFDGAVTRFLYDGDRLVAEYDGADAVTARHVHGPGPDEALVWYDGAGLTSRRWLHADHQNSTVAVSTAAAAIVGAPYTYDPYGAPDAVHGFDGVRFRYTGQISLTHAPYWHYKARAYQPQLGRFLQTDPVGYEDGLNLYAYVGNDPMNLTDPTGMCAGGDSPALCRMSAMHDTSEAAAVRAAGERRAAEPIGRGLIVGALIGLALLDGPEPGPADAAAASLAARFLGSSRRNADDAAEGIVYRRTNPETGRCYIGRCNSESLFQRRQREHNRNLGVDHDYEIIDRAPQGRPLREAEQRQIDAHGGPTNRSNPNGGTENRRHEIRTGSRIRR